MIQFSLENENSWFFKNEVGIGWDSSNKGDLHYSMGILLPLEYLWINFSDNRRISFQVFLLRTVSQKFFEKSKGVSSFLENEHIRNGGENQKKFIT